MDFLEGEVVWRDYLAWDARNYWLGWFVGHVPSNSSFNDEVKQNA